MPRKPRTEHDPNNIYVVLWRDHKNQRHIHFRGPDLDDARACFDYCKRTYGNASFEVDRLDEPPGESSPASLS